MAHHENGDQPEPALRLAECLAAAGEAAAAEAVLREALRGSLARHDELWEAWLRTAFAHLGLAPAELLAMFPVRLHPSSRGRAADARWLLETLASGAPLRLNCGGGDEAHRDLEGKVWGRDAFFRGGQPWYHSDLEPPAGSRRRRVQPVHTTTRWLPSPERILPAYAVPLPRGMYRVTLHFIEGGWPLPEDRTGRFDVRIEDGPVLEAYAPLDAAGPGVPDVRTFEVPVQDGQLEIDFARLEEGLPCIAGIEIELAGR
jgi:hypothetical protein